MAIIDDLLGDIAAHRARHARAHAALLDACLAAGGISREDLEAEARAVEALILTAEIHGGRIVDNLPTCRDATANFHP